MRLNNLEQDTYDADRLQESEEFTPVVSPVVAPAATPAADAPKPTDAMLRGKEMSQTQFPGMEPVYQSSEMATRGDPGILLGYKFQKSQIQEPGMVPIYSPVTYAGRGDQFKSGGDFQGYGYLPENGIIEVPKPASILAEEQRLGKQFETIYHQDIISRGRGGSESSEPYGPPIGYFYDNGQSQYVNFDASGTYQNTVDRKGDFDNLLPLVAIMAAAYFGPAAFEFLGLTGTGAGAGTAAAGSTAGAFLPIGTTSMVLSAPTTLSAWVASPFLATGSTISAVTGIAMTPEIAALLGQVVIETVSNGGDAGLALKNAATSYGINFAAGQINNAISSVVNQAPSNVLSDSAKKAVTAGLTNATIAAVTGKDPLSALAAAGASYIAPNLLKQIPGYGDMPADLKKIGSAAIQASLLGKNPTEAALNTALQLGKQAITSYIDTTTGLSQKIKDLRTGVENSLATGVKDLTQLATDSTKTQTEDKEQVALDAKVFNANGMKLDTINDAAKAASAAGFTTFKYGDSTYNITGNFETTPTVSTTTNAAGQNQITAGSPASSVTSAGPTEGQLALTKKLNDLAALAREGENISEGEKVAIRHQEEKQQLKPGEAMFTVSDTMTPGERNQLIESTIGRATDFNEAYAAARAGYGAGKTFTWNGNSYSTSTRAEDPKLAEASDKIRVDRITTALNAGAGRGTVNDTGVRPATTVDFLKAYFGESAAKDDIAWRDAISKKILDGGYKGTDERGLQIVRATNLVDHLQATGARAIGEQAQSFAGAWSTATGSSYANGFAEWGKYLEKWGQDRTGAEIQKEMDAVDKRIGEIGKMSGWDQPIAYAKLIKENPWAVGNYALIETFQEVVPVAAALTGAGLAIVAGAELGTIASVAALASATSDALEVFGNSGKSAYDSAYKQAVKSGASPDQANRYAQNKAVNVATVDAAITLGTEYVSDRFMLTAGLKSIGASLAAGSAQEFIENVTQSINQDAQLNKPIDINKALSQGWWGAIIAPGASTMTMGAGAVINSGVTVGKDLLGNAITFADLKEGKKDIDYSSLNGNSVIATSANGSKITLAGWTAAAASNSGVEISDYSAFMPSSLTDGSTAAVTLANGKEITVGDIEDVTNNNTNITGTDFINDVSTMTPAQIVRTYTDEVLSGNTQLNTETRNNVLSQKPVNFDNTGTVLAINDNGTSLVQNDTTGAQSTVQTIGDATVGSTVDLNVSATTGEITAIAKTGTTGATDAVTGATSLTAGSADAATTGATTGDTTGAVTNATIGATTADAASTTGNTTANDATTIATTGDTNVTSNATTSSQSVTQTQLDNAIGNLSADQKTQFDNLTQSQKDEVASRIQQGQDIQNAIASSQQTTSNQIQNIETNLSTRIDQLVEQGVTKNEAVQQAIAETQTQINKNDVNVNTRIDTLVRQGVDYQKATQIAFDETKSTINDVGTKLADKIKADDEAKKAADAAALAKDIAAKQAAAKASKEAQQKGAQRGALSLLQPNAGAASDVLSQAGPLAAVYLAAKEDPNKFESPLEKFLRVQDQSLGKENQYGTKVQGNAMNDPSYSYGTQRPIEDILNMGSAQATQAGQAGQAPDASMQTLPTAVNYAQGGITGTRHGKYAQGGLSTLMMASGGKMRVDFRRGDAVTGAGDGQSDDIPAMLADGEFVFPADVVSAIGNGSTKAGSDKLYDMMHGIRAHARSAKPKDLPPQIKSPLDFLKRS